MVKRVVRLYIEGGATGKDADNIFRKSWKQFLNNLHDLARQNGYDKLEIVRGKGRENTFQRCMSHKEEYPNDLCVLLVDSETGVSPSSRVWEIVKNRDNWQQPAGALCC